MTSVCRFLVVALGLLGLLGCQTAGDETKSSRTLITSENVSQIVGTRWILKEMTIDGNEHRLTRKRPFVQFDNDGEVSGFASVNRFSGRMQLDSQGRIRWFPLRSTRMAGPRELMDQESAFLLALPRTCCLSLDETCLHVQSEDGQVEFVLRTPAE